MVESRAGWRILCVPLLCGSRWMTGKREIEWGEKQVSRLAELHKPDSCSYLYLWIVDCRLYIVSLKLWIPTCSKLQVLNSQCWALNWGQFIVSLPRPPLPDGDNSSVESRSSAACRSVSIEASVVVAATTTSTAIAARSLNFWAKQSTRLRQRQQDYHCLSGTLLLLWACLWHINKGDSYNGSVRRQICLPVFDGWLGSQLS